MECGKGYGIEAAESLAVDELLLDTEMHRDQPEPSFKLLT